RPLVAKALKAVAFGQRRSFPDAGGATFELGDQARPIVDLAGGAVAAVDGLRAGSKASRRAAETLERPEQINREIDPVDRHIKQVAGSGRVLVLPPAPTRFGPVEKPLTAEVPQFAQASARDQMPQVPHRWSEAIGKRRHVDELLVAAGVVHLPH